MDDCKVIISMITKQSTNAALAKIVARHEWDRERSVTEGNLTAATIFSIKKDAVESARREIEIASNDNRDEITKFVESFRPLTAEEHKMLDEHFWELLSLSEVKPLPDSLTQDDGPFIMGVIK